EGVHPEAVSDLKELVFLHPDLIDLPRIIVGLGRVLDAADTSPVLEISGRDTTVWHEVCAWITSLKNRSNISTVIGEKFWLGDIKHTRNPVKNQGDGVKVFGFPYAVLWSEPKDRENAADYYRLIAQLLVSFQRSQNPDDLT